MGATNVTLDVARRDPGGSRTARRLRRAGQVPGVVYGGGDEPVAVQVALLPFKRVLAHASAVLDLSVDGEGVPVILKDLQRHPLTGDPVHADFLRVRMDELIQTTVVIELTGYDEAPGPKEGGVIEQVHREVTVEALPRDLPEHLTLDISGVAMNETLTLAALPLPEGVTLVDDPEFVVVTCSPPRLEVEPDDEPETETERIGDPEAEAAEGDGDAETGTTPG